jgi:hypothetical protein
VFIGPPKPGSDAATQVAAKPSNRVAARGKNKTKPETATAAVAPAAEPKADAKPATANAGGFSLTPSIKLPGIGSFAPASAEEKPVAAPEAKPAEKKTAAKPEPKPAKSAAKPDPKAKPEPKTKSAATKKPDPTSTKQ